MSTNEELKREMYYDLKRVGGMVGETHLYKTFEESLEAYLEGLRQERENLIITRASIIEERDAYLRKLQAFEFANQSAGEFLQEAQAKVSRQRQSIGQLKNERDNARNLAGSNYTKYQKARQELSELRKQLGATRIQNESENASGDELKRFDWHSASTCLHRWTQLEPGASLVCRECLVIADVHPKFHPIGD